MSENEHDGAWRAVATALRLLRGAVAATEEAEDEFRALATERDRYRALLERLIACDNVSASVADIESVIADARRELGL